MNIEKHKLIFGASAQGFTLVELLLYVSLLAIFVTGSVLFGWDVVYAREKAFQQQIVAQSARIATEKIAYEVRSADSIVSVSPSQLELANDAGGTTEITYANDSISIFAEGVGTSDLTSNQIRVTNFAFTQTSNLQNNSKGVSVSAIFEQANQQVSGQLTAKTQVNKSIELKGKINDSGSLLVDSSAANLASGNSLEGVVLQNISIEDIVIESMKISWSGTSGNEFVQSIQINAGTEEWSGNALKGETIDITDFPISQSDGIINLDYISFDFEMGGSIIFVEFILSDGSSKITKMIFDSSGGQPVVSCNEYCTGIDYIGGICRKNAKACTDNNEIREAGGDTYCTGDANADTCCCAP